MPRVAQPLELLLAIPDTLWTQQIMSAMPAQLSNTITHQLLLARVAQLAQVAANLTAILFLSVDVKLVIHSIHITHCATNATLDLSGIQWMLQSLNVSNAQLMLLAVVTLQMELSAFVDATLDIP
jgi:hypothetical protein